MEVTDITWDTDGLDAKDLGLPTSVKVDAEKHGITSHDELADWLSDKYGWTVSGYSCPELDGPSPAA